MIPFREENALLISRSLGLRRGKNDKSDALDLCRYAFEKRDSIEPTTLCNPLIVKLSKLLSRRELLVKQKKAMKVSFCEQKPFLEPDLLILLHEQSDQVVALLTKQIKELEAKIEQIIKSDQSLRRNSELAQSVVGIGPIQSAFIIVYTHNFTRFVNARQFASYAGLAPFIHGQSGVKTGVSKVSHLANKKMKSLLGMGARAALQFDREIQDYYHRKIEEGKPKALVLNNVKNKLVQRVFATIKRQSPYVKLMNYA
jgi:transposase